MAQSGSQEPVVTVQQPSVHLTPLSTMPRLEIDTGPVSPSTARTSAIFPPLTKSRVPWLFIFVLVILLCLGGLAYWFYPQLVGGTEAVRSIFFPTSTEGTSATEFPIEEVMPNGATITPTTTASSTDNQETGN